MTWPTFTVELGDVPGIVPSTWTDVTDLVLSTTVPIAYGRGNELADNTTGTSSLVLDNLDGAFGVGVDPMTALRITAVHDSTTYPLGYQIVDSGPVVWPFAGREAAVDLALTDGMALLALTEVGETTRPAERPGTRIAALLDLAGWPAGMRDLDDGQVMLDPLGEYDANGDLQDVIVNALAAIYEAVRAEQGQVYVGPDGAFVFRGRHSRLDNTAMATLGSASIRYQDLVPKYDGEFLWPTVRAHQSDGTVAEFSDEAAIASGYGGLDASQPGRVYVMNDLATSDIEVNAIAAWIVTRYATPTLRISRLVLTATAEDDAALTALLTMRPGSLLRVQSDAVGGGAALDTYQHVERIEHSIGRATWTAALALSPYFGAGPWLRFDDASVGFDEGGLAP